MVNVRSRQRERLRLGFAIVAIAATVLLLTGPGLADTPSHATTELADPTILVQSTTSTANSGLYDHLLPQIKQATGVVAKIVAVGTGQAIRNARNCDADVLLVHAKVAEEMFVQEGFGVARYDLMYNDFIVVSPASDPAGVAGEMNAIVALKKIAEKKAVFASRGDDSGTHKKELALWQEAGVNVDEASGKWYRETGSGMGATLNVGVGMGAYVLTDRATWISFANKGQHAIAVEGDDRLFNQYGVIQVSDSVCPNVNTAAAERFVSWLLSDVGQQAIAEHKIDDQQLFFPNAHRAE